MGDTDIGLVCRAGGDTCKAPVRQRGVLMPGEEMVRTVGMSPVGKGRHTHVQGEMWSETDMGTWSGCQAEGT